MKLLKRYVGFQKAYENPSLSKHELCPRSCIVYAVCSMACYDFKQKIREWAQRKILVFNAEGEELVLMVCVGCIRYTKGACAHYNFSRVEKYHMCSAFRTWNE